MTKIVFGKVLGNERVKHQGFGTYPFNKGHISMPKRGDINEISLCLQIQKRLPIKLVVGRNAVKGKINTFDLSQPFYQHLYTVVFKISFANN